MYNIMIPFIFFAIRADLVILTTLLFYVPSLFWCQDYLFDDEKAIISNPDVVRQNNSFVKIFCHDFWGTKLTDPSSHKSYRPLTILVFRFIFSWNSIILFRIFNIILHLINTYLVTKLSRLLDCKGWLLTSLIFGLHPVHAEPVLAFVGASDLLYSQVILISLIMVITYRNDLVYGVSSFLCLLSVAYKEQGIMLLPMVLALDVFVKKNRFKKVCLKILYIIVLSFTILYWRLYIMNFDPPSFQEGDNPASFIKNPFLRILNYSYIYIMNLWILIAPVWLCFDWSMGCISTIQEPTKDFRTFIVIFSCGLAILCLRKCIYCKKILLILILGVLPFLPSMNIFFRVGFVIAERNLYLSLLGFSLFIGEGFCVLRKSKLKNIFAAITILFFGLACIKRSRDWSSESQLFFSGLKVCPRNAKIYYNIAKRESERSHPDMNTVIRFYKESLHLWPNYGHAMNNLGNAYRSIKEYDKAHKLYKRALELSPSFSSCWMNLGVLYTALENYKDAEDCYLKALEYRQGYSDCYYNLGILYVKIKRLIEAKSSFIDSIQWNPNSFKSWVNLIILLDEMKEFIEAEDICLKALRFFPESPDLKFHLANIYGKTEKYDLAERFYMEAINQSKIVKPIYYLNLGVLYHLAGQLELAYNRYKMVLEMDPSNKSAKRNLAKLEGY